MKMKLDRILQSPGTAPNPSHPKLGDLSSLQLDSLLFKPSFDILSITSPGTENLSLGNLSRIVEQLRTASPSGYSSLHDSFESVTDTSSDEDHLCRHHYQFRTSSPVSKGPQATKIQDRGRATSTGHCRLYDDNCSIFDPDIRYSCTSNRFEPHSGPDACVSSRANDTQCPLASTSPKPVPSAEAKPRHTFQTSPRPRSTSSNLLLSYRFPGSDTSCHIYGCSLSREEAYQSLTRKLTVQRVLDALTARLYPEPVKNGVYVFLDMSNIEISFQTALKAKHALVDNVRFSPLPRLNLDFLREILVRERVVRSMVVSCSTIPGRHEPSYVRQLRNMGFRVDLRNRKRIDQAAPDLSNKVMSSSTIRYVEELVDETLQTRIAEAVMEYFQQQGTIVLATGDAKPAEYSDGFFAYVERALRMGWNVEVVSWRRSLSNAWKDRHWRELWGERFSIIELDQYLEEILVYCG